MIKIFGAAFDPLDIPERVDLKVAYLNWIRNFGMPENDFLDPYELLENNFREKNLLSDKIEWSGKFPIESWLRPKPSISDLDFITQERYTEFLDKNGCRDYYGKLVEYLIENMGSSIPVMIGVDHSLTAAVLRYLKGKYDGFNVVVFDSHCDMIDIGSRKDYFGSYSEGLEDLFGEKDIFECGSFLSQMLEEKIIKPKDIWIIGSQDLARLEENTRSLFSKKLLPWIEQGIHILSKDDLILSGIPDEIRGQTYISFDMDLGSLASVFAARFLNYIGLDFERILDLIFQLSKKIRTNKIELIGLDIMEIDIHFVGVDINGNRDHTAEIASEILEKVIYKNFG